MTPRTRKRFPVCIAMLAVLLLAALCPMGAFADAGEYGITVKCSSVSGENEIKVTAQNADNILGNGTLWYDVQSNTIKTKGSISGDLTITVESSTPVDVDLSMSCTETSGENSHIVNGDLTVTGARDVTLVQESTGENYAGNVVEGNVDVTCTGAFVLKNEGGSSSNGRNAAKVVHVYSAASVENEGGIEEIIIDQSGSVKLGNEWGYVTQKLTITSAADVDISGYVYDDDNAVLSGTANITCTGKVTMNTNGTAARQLTINNASSAEITAQAYSRSALFGPVTLNNIAGAVIVKNTESSGDAIKDNNFTYTPPAGKAADYSYSEDDGATWKLTRLDWLQGKSCIKLEASSTYNVTIAGRQVTEANKGNVLYDDGAEVVYDSAANKLTVKKFITNCANLNIVGDGDTDIEIVCENQSLFRGDSYDKDLTITGAKNVTVTGTSNGADQGFFPGDASITCSGNITLQNPVGPIAEGDLTLECPGTVQVQSPAGVPVSAAKYLLYWATYSKGNGTQSRMLVGSGPEDAQKSIGTSYADDSDASYFNAVPIYEVSVTSGTASAQQAEKDIDGDLWAEEGTIVTLTADPAPEEQLFAGWQVVSGPAGWAFDGQTDSFTMPAGPVELKAVYRSPDAPEPAPVEPEAPAANDSFGEGVAFVALGSAAVYGGYEIATRVILNELLPEGAAIPKNRAELALMVWNTAGCPEPAAAPTLADVAPETAKAAQWCVEQGLLEAEPDGTFDPTGWTPKFRVIEVWNKAFPKE